MWFKNIQWFLLNETFQYDSVKLDEELSSQRSKPCPSTQDTSIGWSSPFGDESEVLVHSAGPYYLIAATKQERILPASVVKEHLDKRIAIIEAETGKQVYSKQKASMRDEVRFDLLPKAFTRKKTTYVYIDTQNNWLCIDTSSRKLAEEITELLRKSLGSLSLRNPEPNQEALPLMSQWLLNNSLPSDFVEGQDCDMLDKYETSSTIKFKQQDLSSPEVTNHIKEHKQVSRIGLTWQDRISLSLNHDLSITRLKFLDVIQDARDEINAETEAQALDADFALMTGELTALLNAIITTFGGLSEGDSDTQTTTTTDSTTPTEELTAEMAD